MQYLINEGHFTLPGNWQGSSMNILTPVLSAIAGANVVVTREILPDGALFDDYLVVQKKKFRTELSKMVFTVEERCHVQERPAEYWEFSWDNKGVMIQQLLLVILNERQVLTLTYSSTQALAEEDRKAMRGVLLNFCFGMPQDK
ncbi:DcrB-related protein [Escherichia coli]|uniref:DcrB-related protein n=1 Tax=Escherichia coli TaxID=562 RepID=UPI000DDF3952|nr:DcrB-related protein [Escherichia coli]